MDTTFLNAKFERMGARLKILHRPGRRARTQGVLSLDIGTDRLGEYFEIAPQVDASPSIEVIDLQPANRHLLLLVREDTAKNKYLCGHDERHWFVAGIPEKASVGTVRQAMEALRPKEVQLAVAQNSLSGRVRNRRKNEAFVRQGEWFFLPVQNLVLDGFFILERVILNPFRLHPQSQRGRTRIAQGNALGLMVKILASPESLKGWDHVCATPSGL